MDGWDWVATYAALVSTGALALEVRRWFESGVRLRLSLITGAVVLNDPFVDEDKQFLHVHVANYGDRPTTVENLVLLEFSGRAPWWCRFRLKASKAGVVANPALPGRPQAIPAQLGVGQTWSAHVLWPEVEAWRNRCEGRLWIAVYCSHSTRPALIRIPLT